MKKILLAVCLTPLLFSCKSEENTMDYHYQDVPFTHVHFNDHFWAPRIETIRTVTVPFAFAKCEETGRIDNFAIAAKLMEGKFRTVYPFDDSDVFKIMEGASFLLAVQKDEKLDAYLDSLISLIGAAQEPDGYLYTNRTINNPPHPWIGKERWVNEWDNSHETYNAGHMYEAAVAHYLATGKRNFLDIAIKNADLMCRTFNPQGLCIAPGHEVIEMGLVKLYRATGDKKYLDLSRFFLEARGKSTRFDKNSLDIFRNGEYWQDHLPVVQQREAVGHAVRATYLYAGMADIAAIMDDEAYLQAVDSIWANIVGKKMYITGGIGSTAHGEAFGKNYELPNATAYCETCAAISNCMFNHRMFMLHGDAKYMDVLERSLYNGMLSGIDLSGDKFFYPNPLEVGKAGQARSEWFDCSCCPSNLSRFIPSIPGYMYATDKQAVYVNLFAQSSADVPFHQGNVHIEQTTEYPWKGDIALTVNPKDAGNFTLKIRIPGWAQNEVVPSDLYAFTETSDQKTVINLNGRPYKYKEEKGYAAIKNDWKEGDKLTISFPMQARTVKANSAVEADKDRLSVEYGPLVYCAEFVDNGDFVSNRTIAPNTAFAVEYKPELLGGSNVLKGKSMIYTMDMDTKSIQSVEGDITLIPYPLRSHRGNGEMSVWLPDNPEAIKSKYMQAFRIVDAVIVANAESEKAHNLQGSKTNFGGSANGWRDAADGGWFSYDMDVVPNEPLELVLTYYSQDGGNRFFEILADGVKIGEQKLRTETFTEMIERNYPIPAELLKGKKKVTIKIQAVPGNIAGGVWGCRIQRAE